jgi:hypothetical protein
MSSLQKFHRRTMSTGPKTWPATVIGMGDATHGYWLGDAPSNKLIAGPQNDSISWGSNGISRGTTSDNDGVSNTNTLYSFGQAAHPAAYFCKSLTTGGYNTWYMPAKNEVITMLTNIGNYAGANFQSSTEYNANFCVMMQRWAGTTSQVSTSNNMYYNKSGAYTVRAIRRTSV